MLLESQIHGPREGVNDQTRVNPGFESRPRVEQPRGDAAALRRETVRVAGWWRGKRRAEPGEGSGVSGLTHCMF